MCLKTELFVRISDTFCIGDKWKTFKLKYFKLFGVLVDGRTNAQTFFICFRGLGGLRFKSRPALGNNQYQEKNVLS